MIRVIKKRLLKVTFTSFVSTVAMSGTMALLSNASAQAPLVIDEVIQQVVAVQHDPAAVARIVRGAVAADRDSAEVIVGAAVSLVPLLSGEIITAADSALQDGQAAGSAPSLGDTRPRLAVSPSATSTEPPVRLPGSTFR
jgi:hypothetical protein